MYAGITMSDAAWREAHVLAGYRRRQRTGFGFSLQISHYTPDAQMDVLTG